MRNSISKFLLIPIILIFIIIIIIRIDYFLIKFANFFTIDEYSNNADAVVILSGSSTTRISKGIELVNNMYAQEILLTTPKLMKSNINIDFENNLVIAQQIAELKNFNSNFTLVPSLKDGATSTYDEAHDILNYSKLNGYRHIIIVTDFYHTRRALFAFNRVFKNSDIKVESAAAYNDIFNETNWWKYDIGITSYILEPIKLIIYFFTSSNVDFINNI